MQSISYRQSLSEDMVLICGLPHFDSPNVLLPKDAVDYLESDSEK
jgi:hypothetical protein